MSALIIAYTGRLMSAITAMIQLAHTRRGVRLHPHPKRGPGAIAAAREHAIATLAEAAALGTPLDRDELRKWATWIEAGAEDRAEDIVLVRRLMKSLDAATRAKLNEAIEACPRCTGRCRCDARGCMHTCMDHDLGGGACTVEGCQCKALVQHTRVPVLFYEAHELATAAAKLPVNGDDGDEDTPRESGEQPRSSRTTLLPCDAGGA